MIKNPKSAFPSDRPVYLYDRVKNDIFEDCHNKETTIIPSITTIFLLQLQASIVKVVTMLPSKNAQATIFEAYAPLRLIRQTMRWLLLAGLLILDNIARLLNVEDEINQLAAATKKKKNYQNERDYTNETLYRPASLSSLSSTASSSNENDTTTMIKQRYNHQPHGSSGATSPTLTRCSRLCCTTPDPPYPTFYPSPPPSSACRSPSPEAAMVRRVREKCISFPSSYKQSTISHEKSSTQQTGRHTRSVSTNSIKFLSKKPSQNSTLRRTTTQTQPRHTVLKETSAWANKKHVYHSSSSSSGSSCESVRPTMKKTRSSTTENNQAKERIQKPYERCCPACISSQHN